MATKAEIKQQIQDNLTLNPSIISDVDHENCLHTQANSLLEAIYPDEIVDTHLTNNVFTKVVGSDVEYLIRVVKQGRVVNVNCEFTVNSGTPFALFYVSNTEYSSENISSFRAITFTSLQEIGTIFNSINNGVSTFFATSVVIGRKTYFQMSYNTKD